MGSRYVVVDVETTGNSFKKGARIIQISAVTIEKERIVDQYTSYVNPETPIPPFIQELTGIDEETVAEAPLFAEIAPQIAKLMKGAVFVAHNVTFDKGFVKGEMKAAGCVFDPEASLDTVELANIMLPGAYSYKLDDLAEQLNLELARHHQADSDALATAQILLFFINKLKSLPLVTLESLCSLSTSLKHDFYGLFSMILKDKRETLEDLAPGLEVYRGIALRQKNYSMPDTLLRVPDYPKAVEEKEAVMRSALPDFSLREGQFELMDLVHEAFSANKHAVVEAGTGTGKSIGYLLPSIFFAKKTGRPVLVSTYTIQLQHQLLENDLKALEAALPFEFTSTLIKGREHYVHLWKFEQSLREKASSYEETITKMKMLIWLLETETGDADELNVSSGGALYWERISNRHVFADEKNNPWISRDFYHYAKERAQESEIVVTNHAMLVEELIENRQTLPHTDHFIVDEAHHLEAATRKKFSYRMNYNDVKYLIGKLSRFEKKRLPSKLDKQKTAEMEKATVQLEEESEQLFIQLGAMLTQNQGSSKQRRPQLRVTEQLRQSRTWQSALYCAERWLDAHKRIAVLMSDSLADIRKSTAKTEAEQALGEELSSFSLEWERLRENVLHLMIRPEEDKVIWMEQENRSAEKALTIYGQPLFSMDWLADRLFGEKKSVVLTSASLTVNNSFSFFNKQIGIEGYPLIEKKIESPYPYKDMVKLLIPEDLPDVKSTPVNDYAESVAAHLISVAYAAKGRMLVLFTSHEMLRKTHELLTESRQLDDFVLLAQGISSGSRTRLIKNFKHFPKAILLGTSSFWEGIDIPGEKLSCLVVVRLPFAPIEEPYHAAKMDMLKAEGKNPFSSYSLPNAIIQFRQGFGRLIRSRNDRGIFMILDGRITSAMYGKAFLQSIPQVDVQRGDLLSLLPVIENWLENHH